MRDYKFDDANKYSAELQKHGGNFVANNPKFLMWRGRVLLYTGNEVAAKKHLQQAMQFDPDLKECMLYIKSVKKNQDAKDAAAEVFKAGKFQEAIEEFEKCLELDPMNSAYNSTLLLNIAICYTKIGKNELAIPSLNKAIKYNPKYAKALVKRGEINLVLENHNEAIRDFNEASEYDSHGFGVQEKLKNAQAAAKRAKKKDYYKILGVSKQAQEPEIRKAYKKLALKWHPDKHNGSDDDRAKADKMFREINEAKDVLTDREMRDKYDNGMDLDQIKSGGGGGGMGGQDMNDIFQMFMGGGMGGGRRGGRGGGDPFAGMGGMGGGSQGFTFRFG